MIRSSHRYWTERKFVFDVQVGTILNQKFHCVLVFFFLRGNLSRVPEALQNSHRQPLDSLITSADLKHHALELLARERVGKVFLWATVDK